MKSFQSTQLGERGKQIIEKKIKKIVCDLSGIKPARLKSTVHLRNELGIESFTALEIIVSIEKEFSVLIAEKQIAKLTTFQDLIDYVFTNQAQSD